MNLIPKNVYEVIKLSSRAVNTSSIRPDKVRLMNMPAGRADRTLVNVQFQPVLPISLTENWNLINRPVLQVLNSAPYINRCGNFHRVTGFGDTVFVSLLSPSDNLAGNWLLGVGPTFIFPTASSARLGQNKCQNRPLRWHFDYIPASQVTITISHSPVASAFRPTEEW